MLRLYKFASGAAIIMFAHPVLAQYTMTNLVANDPVYQPLNLIDPLLSNGWGLALRPPGAGGHFWISNTNTGTTTTHVGDVHTPGGFVPLHQDALRVVRIAVGAGERLGRPTSETPQPTGQVYNYSTSDFVVSGEGITAASKFIFVTAEGTISGWTEATDPGTGVLRRQTVSVIKVDQSQEFDDERLRFTGCAVTDFASGNRLYAANWTAERVEVYDHLWQPVTLPVDRFRYPDQPEGYRPWNVQYLHTGPLHEGRIWVTYNLVDDPWEELPNFGAVAEFDLDGNFIRRLWTSTDFDSFADMELRDPWGLALAPANFGPMSNKLLIANFGDGTIAAYDLESGLFVDFLRDVNGNVLIVDGVWGITFGNGVALGDANALYFAAGPNGEEDGTFGTLRYFADTCPSIRQQPAPVAACAGQNATLTVDAVGPAWFSYQWRRNGVALNDGAVVGGATVAGVHTATLALTGVHVDDAGAFDVVLSNDCGTVTSAAAMLAVSVPSDANCDGLVNNFDIDAFVAAVVQGHAAWQSAHSCDFFCANDANHDGAVNNFDIDAFVECILNGCP